MLERLLRCYSLLRIVHEDLPQEVEKLIVDARIGRYELLGACQLTFKGGERVDLHADVSWP